MFRKRKVNKIINKIYYQTFTEKLANLLFYRFIGIRLLYLLRLNNLLEPFKIDQNVITCNFL